MRSLAAVLLLLTAALTEPPRAVAEVMTGKSAWRPDPITVIDGDTVRVGPTVFRLVGFDTPEFKSRCPEELYLARKAKNRLEDIVNDRTYRITLTPVACSCSPGTQGTPYCNYGRACAILSVGGANVARTMIDERLAVSYTCSPTRCPPRRNWCN